MNAVADDKEPDLPALRDWAASQRDSLIAAKSAALGLLALVYLQEKAKIESQFEAVLQQIDGGVEMIARDRGGDVQH